jgi:hypothetical protein
VICGFDAIAAGLASAQSYWRIRKVKYAVVGPTHSDFGSSSRIFRLCSSIKAKAGECTANFRMRNSARNVGDDQGGRDRFRCRSKVARSQLELCAFVASSRVGERYGDISTVEMRDALCGTSLREKILQHYTMNNHCITLLCRVATDRISQTYHCSRCHHVVYRIPTAIIHK